MIALIVTSLIWAFSFGLIKHYLTGLDPNFVACARLGLALIPFVPWLRWRSVGARGMAELGLLGALQFGLMYLLYLWAFRSLQAYQVALLTVTTPVLICLGEDLLRLRCSIKPILTALLATVGAAVVLGVPGFAHARWQGIALIQASNLCFALGQVLYRRVRQRYPNTEERYLFSWLYLGAFIVTLPMTLNHLATAVWQVTWVQAALLIYLGCIASGLGFFLWNHGSLRVSTAVLAVMNDAKTPLGVLVSLVVFRESVRLDRLLVGGSLVLLAAILAQRLTRASAADHPTSEAGNQI